MNVLKEITMESTKDKLNEYRYSFLCVLDEIEHSLRSHKKMHCYMNDSTIIIFDDNYDIPYINVCFINDDIDYGVIFNYIDNIQGEINISIHAFKNPTCKVEKTMFDNKYTFVKEYRGFLKRTNDDFCDSNIRFLSTADSELAQKFNHEESVLYRPPFSVLFDVFVNKSEGKILSYFMKNELVGYLSYELLFDNVYDVDYIYVSPAYRNLGIGKALARSYVREVIVSKGIALWSNAQNIASEKVALSCGFTLCRKDWCYKKSKAVSDDK